MLEIRRLGEFAECRQAVAFSLAGRRGFRNGRLPSALGEGVRGEERRGAERADAHQAATGKRFGKGKISQGDLGRGRPRGRLPRRL